MLKVEDKIVSNSIFKGSQEVSYKNYSYTIYYDNSMSSKERESLVKEREALILSIERRKKLLSNENYLAKAPKQIVEKEKDDLAIEEDKLNKIDSLLG